MAQQNPGDSALSAHNERDLLIKILAEMRVQTMILAQGFGINDDIDKLRDEVMSMGNTTQSSL